MLQKAAGFNCKQLAPEDPKRQERPFEAATGRDGQVDGAQQESTDRD
jgi:hypothetical protein